MKNWAVIVLTLEGTGLCFMSTALLAKAITIPHELSGLMVLDFTELQHAG